MNYRSYLDIEAVARENAASEPPFQVMLGHYPNFDISGTDGYWQETVDPWLPRMQPAGSLADAARICRDFIARNGLGGGNWGSPVGDLFAWSADGILTKIGRVSFNGRLWDNDNVEIKLQEVQG